MDKRTIVLVVCLFLTIIIGMFIFAHLKREEAKYQEFVPSEVVKENTAYDSITRIDAKHFYFDGKHTFVGEIILPTPCDLLVAESIIRESYPEQIELKFSVINNSTDCEAVPTAQRFQVEASALSEAVVSASFMGRSVQLNLIPPAPGETPADFELYIKG